MIRVWGRRRSTLAQREASTLDPLSEAISQLVALRSSGMSVTAHPTVAGVRTLIARSVSMLPLVGLRGSERLNPQPSILRRPDPSEPREQTIEKIVNSMTRLGNAFLRVYQYDADGFPLAIKVLNPDYVTVVLTADQQAIEEVLYIGQPVPRKSWRIIPMNLDPGPLGKSPLQACAAAFEAVLGLWGFAQSYWQDGGSPPYALTHPRRLTAEQSDELLTRWIDARRQRRPGVLSDGLQLTEYRVPHANDVMLLDGLNYFDAAIARAFLVPPSLVNVVSQQSLTYTNTSDELRRWLSTDLYPVYLNRIESVFSDLTPRGQSAVFDTSNLLRTDYAARVATGTQAVAAGLITTEEWRAQEGLPPLPNPAPVPLSPSVEGI